METITEKEMIDEIESNEYKIEVDK